MHVFNILLTFRLQLSKPIKTMKHRIALLMTFGIIAAQLQAQVIGSDAKITTQFMEIGVNAFGAHYIDSIPPGTLTDGINRGFIADVSMDGWYAGYPKTTGDIVSPGSPIEEWLIYTDTGYATIQTTEGITHFSSENDTTIVEMQCDLITSTSGRLTYKQKTIAFEYDRYFIDEITLINIGDSTIYDIYYTRNIDPDQEAEYTGIFTNNIFINSDYPELAQVLATTYDTYFALGSRHAEMRPSFGGFVIESTLPEIYIGAGDYELFGEVEDDISIQNTFYFDSLQQGDSVIFRLAYMFTEDVIEAALQATAFTKTIFPCEESTYFYVYDEDPTTILINFYPSPGAFYFAVLTNLETGISDTIYNITPEFAFDGLEACSNFTIELFKVCNGVAAHQTTLEASTDCVLSLESENAGIQVFPNPASNFIQVTHKPAHNLQWHIMDMQGKSYETQISHESDTSTILHVSNLAEGIYLIHAVDAETGVMHTQKFTKMAD